MSSRPRLSPFNVKNIHLALDRLFDRALVRLLGPQSLDKRIYGANFKDALSIPGVFRAASYEEYTVPDEGTLFSMMENVKSFIDSHRAATKVKVVRQVDSFLQDALSQGVKTNLKTVLDGKLSEVWKDATNNIRRLVDTEAGNARSAGTLDGIIKVNAAHDIEDPVVFKVIVRDNHVCDTCLRLHLLEDGVTPRLWYLSELGNGYGKKDDERPVVGPQHPSCRCSLVTCLNGFGFNSKGMVEFKGLKYNAIREQRRTEKSEEYTHHDCDCRREKLEKGSLQARNPYSPARDTSDEERYHISEWQNYAGPEDREKIPRLEGPGRTRALQKLHTQTRSRRNPGTGEREFLLHRATGPGDSLSTITSWTTQPETAKSFVRGDRKLESRWIPEGHIHHVLAQVGYVNDSATARVHGNQPKPGLSVPHPTDPDTIPRAIGKPGYREGEVLVKYETNDCQPLEKAEWNTNPFLQQLRRLGWTEDVGGKKHREIRNTLNPGLPPLRLKYEHAHKIPANWTNTYLKQIGLRSSIHNEIEPDPESEFSPAFRSAGLLEEDATVPKMKTWTPAGSEGHVHVPIEQVISTAPSIQDWKRDKFMAQMRDLSRPLPIPPVRALRQGDQYHVSSGDEQLEAARALGMTHVPVTE